LKKNKEEKGQEFIYYEYVRPNNTYTQIQCPKLKKEPKFRKKNMMTTWEESDSTSNWVK